ncbi:MAG: tRNA uridine-5-carboxymethylaminomethyl(34) synthesis GTPase MnmE [Flavobacteriales bacterium]|nr:tRNA uridine-5-carboxymethylaminomethyl(34) synthesis GTPase MnmE [Flavobacteriales bacterium]
MMSEGKTNETICALSTAPGLGAIALIRVSGDRAVDVVQPFFSKNLGNVKVRMAVHGWIEVEGEKVDEVVVTIFKAPASFTGEDTVEIACHGSLYIRQRIIELLISAGARMAQPGEFTMRAFLCGKMDLSQAEAIGDLIASETAAAHKQAIHQMRGGFSQEINGLRQRLIHFASMVELELDFAEEDVEFANRDQMQALLLEILQVVNRLKDSFRLGNAMKNGVPVAIIGAPNAGKSTLLNALLNEERAIVSDIAGTTRDIIEDHMTIEGVRFNFIDTAGIRDTSDEIERIGIERAMAKVKSAEVILLIFDVMTTSYDELTALHNTIRKEAGEGKLMVTIANKTDHPDFDKTKFMSVFEGLEHLILISARQKLNLDELRSLLIHHINIGQINQGETIVTNMRHYEALTKASSSLQEVLHGVQSGITGDFLAIDIRKSLYHLGEITGQINADDLLNNIFSSFCIGK